MDDITKDHPHGRYLHYPREVAAHVTLGSAAAALVAPVPRDGAAVANGACVAITTACAALATRLSLLTFLAAPAHVVEAGLAPPRRADDFPSLPDRLRGGGEPPVRERLVLAGDRCVEAWRRWVRDPDAGDYPHGVAGALSLSAWCSWSTGSAARARTRASYALDVWPDDPLAALVERWCRARIGPTWWCVDPASRSAGPTVG